MYCNNCGSKVPQNAKFCEQCGTPVAVCSDDTLQASSDNTIKSYSQDEQRLYPRLDETEPVVYPDLDVIGYNMLSERNTDGKRNEKPSGLLYAIMGIGAGVLVAVAILLGLLLYRLNNGSSKVGGEITLEISEKDIPTPTPPTPTPPTPTPPTPTPPTPTPPTPTPPTPTPPTPTPTPPTPTPPTPTPEPETESTYLFVRGDYTWSDAHDECHRLGGHLVHFDEPGEMEKVIKLFTAEGFGTDSIFWIGAMREAEYGSTTYYWVDYHWNFCGELSANDSRWLAGEPTYSYDGIIEDSVMMFYKKGQGWVFNDEANDPNPYNTDVKDFQQRKGFICEFEP